MSNVSADRPVRPLRALIGDPRTAACRWAKRHASTNSRTKRTAGEVGGAVDSGVDCSAKCARFGAHPANRATTRTAQLHRVRHMDGTAHRYRHLVTIGRADAMDGSLAAGADLKDFFSTSVAIWPTIILYG